MAETPTADETSGEAVRALQRDIDEACATADRLREARDDLVRDMADRGCSRPQIAALTGLSKSNIRWITARH